MTAAKILAQGPYGAFELKRCYQKNMLTGTMISVSIPLLILAVFALAGVLSRGEAVLITVPENGGSIIYEIPPPINSGINKGQEIIKLTVERPNIGMIPNPVEIDADVPVKVVASINEKFILALGDGSSVAAGIATGVYKIGEEDTLVIPPPTTFTAYDEAPILLNSPVPDYPVLAQKAGLEGDVVIQVRIDTDGKVIAAEVAKPSGLNAGFEEAAISAAWKRVYRPAMQNGYPVAIWFGYVIKFRLSGH